MDDQVNPDDTAAQIVIAPAWPRDTNAFLSAWRRETARSIGRIKGDEEKMTIFIEHLKAAGAWAKNRMAVFAQIREDAIALSAERVAWEQAHVDANATEQESDDAKLAKQLGAGIIGAIVGKV